MATASKFTEVSVVSSWTLDEANAMLKLMELCHVGVLETKEQILVSGVHQSLKKAINNG